jgi:hypothetical protein
MANSSEYNKYDWKLKILILKLYYDKKLAFISFIENYSKPWLCALGLVNTALTNRVIYTDFIEIFL